MADIGFANVEVLSAANTKVLAINNTRVSLEKGYGLMTPIATFEVAVSDILNALDVQPVRRGHWIWKERHRNSLRVVKGIDRYGKEGDLQIHEEYKEKVNYCSECGKQGHEVSLNFCPNCGARMTDEGR